MKNFFIQSGQHIFLEDMPVTGLYVVQKGIVKEFYLDKEGKQIIKHTAKSGEIFGHRDYSATKHIFSAIAFEDSQICCFNKNILYEVCLHNAELSNNLMNFFLDELNKSDERHKLFSYDLQ
ncbi:MAG: Crp/Fnr family transcriptional regulator [Flavobacteriales bacterium]|nr:Crp/Fnr family transcriptional regulator [Flavobacteriales bacterium]